MVDDQLSHDKPEGRVAEERFGPPMPKFMFRVVNPVMAAVLRSPLHGLLSTSIILLTFHGRKSGKRYTVPIGYLQQGDRLVLFTHSNWWKNLRGQAPVSVRLHGKEVQGTAALLEDPAAIAEAVRVLVERHGETRARRAGIISGSHGPDAAKPPPGTVFIEVKLEERRS